jgi:hypothetical protein
MVLRLRDNAPDWARANCLGTAPLREPGEEEVYDPWFDEEDPGPVLGVCNGGIGPVCPLRDACARFALFNNEKYGVWGGMPPDDRKLTRRLWRWNSAMTEPHPEWRYRSHDELAILRDEMIRSGRTSLKQLEEEDEE